MRIVMLAALLLAVASPSFATTQSHAKGHAQAGGGGRSAGGGSAIAPAWSSGMEPIGQARSPKAAATTEFADPALGSAKSHRAAATTTYGQRKTRRAY